MLTVYADMPQQAPLCKNCGKREWGHICSGSFLPLKDRVPLTAAPVNHDLPVANLPPPKLSAFEKIKEGLTEVLDTVRAGGFAPAGQCPWCDHRREQNAAAQRKRRSKQ